MLVYFKLRLFFNVLVMNAKLISQLELYSVKRAVSVQFM